jgi:iron complex outermembrane receptor protein
MAMILSNRRSGKSPGRAAGVLGALALGATFAGALVSPTAAQDLASNATPAVPTVVVTAERRETDVQHAPLAVTVVSGRTLDESFTTQLTGLNAVVPGLEITQAAGFENLVSIRGVGSETPENALVTVPGVSLFVDGVYVANTISLDESLFDIDRIEVLRGPQGALYGQGSIGGAINLATNQPRLGAYDASGDASFGDYALFRERAEVNVPIGDTLAVRVSAQAFDHDGFTENLARPGMRLDDLHDLSGKVAVLWKPNVALSATATAEIYHADQNGAAQKNILELTTPGLQNPRVVYQDFPATFELTTQLYHLNLQYDAGPVEVRSVTAYQRLSNVQAEDSSRSAYSILHAYDDVAAWNTTLDTYTQELDLLSRPGGRLEWIAGAFVLDQDSRQFVAEYEGTAPPPAAFPTGAGIETQPPGDLSYGNDTRVARQSVSGFAQATYHLAPRLRVTLGGRVNHDHYAQHSYNFSAFDIATVSHGYDDTVGTWLARGEYDLTPASMVYASVSRGYKPGGVNGDNGQRVVPDTFAPETNTAYELGSKTSWLDRRVVLDLAAYVYNYRNFQYIEYDPVPFQSGISNIPRIDEYGVDAEASYVSADHRLRLDLTGSLEQGRVEGDYFTIDSTLANAVVAQGGACTYGGAYNPACQTLIIAGAANVRGRTPPAMPKVSGAVDASYRFDLGAWGPMPAARLTPRVQYVYRGSEYERIFNQAGLDRLDPYGTTNLNLDYEPAGTKLRLSLAATNALNVHGVNSRYTDPYGSTQTSQQYIPPRQIIGTVAYRF